MLTALAVLIAQTAAPQLADPVERWIDCTEREARAFSVLAEGADVIAEAALASCPVETLRVGMEVAREHSTKAEADAMMERMHQQRKRSLIGMILREKLRGRA
jgi:hypothetical protein